MLIATDPAYNSGSQVGVPSIFPSCHTEIIALFGLGITKVVIYRSLSKPMAKFRSGTQHEKLFVLFRRRH